MTAAAPLSDDRPDIDGDIDPGPEAAPPWGEIRSAYEGSTLAVAAIAEAYGVTAKRIWSRAARVPWKQISGELGCDRTTAWRRWQLALTKIASRLNA